MAAPLDPDAWRDRFPILEQSTYLVNHSFGAMPKAVYGILRDFADQWAQRGIRAWSEGWWETPIEVGNLLGRLMNAPPGSVTMQPNVSIIQNIVASSLDFSTARNRVVYTDQNFPTNMYVWQGMRERGAVVEVVPSDPDGTVPTGRLLEAIDETTLIVPISHVSFRSSSVLDAAAVCARAREVGALVLLDTYQSLGTLPFDVTALGVDFVCGGSVKWLCGGPGAAYLYVRPDRLSTFEPRLTGWAAHADPFEFEAGEQRYASDGMRTLSGTPAVVALLAATAGYETVADVGIEAIRAHSMALTERLREGLAEAGFGTFGPSDPHQRGGTLTVKLTDEEDGKAFVATLDERGILVDYRPRAGIRVSPHFYTRADETDAFVHEMKQLRDTDAWRVHASAAGTGSAS